MNRKTAILSLVLLAIALPMLVAGRFTPPETRTTVHVYKAPT